MKNRHRRSILRHKDMLHRVEEVSKSKFGDLVNGVPTQKKYMKHRRIVVLL